MKYHYKAIKETEKQAFDVLKGMSAREIMQRSKRIFKKHPELLHEWYQHLIGKRAPKE
jgi:hypothetical protein